MGKKNKPTKRKTLLESIWQDITLFLYVLNHPNSHMIKMSEDLDLKYPTLHRTLGVRVKQGIIIKTPIRPIVMGEDKFTFTLSKTTIEFLKELSQKINDELK